jgi:S1-C subfamily serine protease
MQGPADSRDDGCDDDRDDGGEPHRAAPGARTWVHPSEVGMDMRGRTDRRRSTILAGGLVIGGLGLLVAGVLMGLGWGNGDEPATSAGPMDGVEPSIASVTVVTPTGRTTATGVLLDGDGHVAVRAGALAGATEVWATCAGHPPTRLDVVAADPTSDVAVVRFADPVGRAVTAGDTPRTGQTALMVRAGSGEMDAASWPVAVDALGLNLVRPDGSVSSRLFRTESRPHTSLASTSVPPTVAPGATDGAVFDGRGRFLGLVVDASDGRQTVTPADRVLSVARALVSDGRVDHPWIGVVATDPAPGAAPGASVAAVDPTGPAAGAGILPGDVIVDVGGRAVTGRVDLATVLEQTDVGSRTSLTVVRSGERRMVSVTTTSRPGPAPQATAAVAAAPTP